MARETHALCCEAVEVGRASDRIAIGAHDVCGVIVRYQEQEIRLPSLLDLCRRGERGRHSSQDGASGQFTHTGSRYLFHPFSPV